MMNLFILAQQPAEVAVSAGGIGALPMIIGLAVGIFMIVAMWKVFVKAGQPGWGCIIPIYNLILLLRIGGKPGWWIFFFLIPVINLVVQIVMLIGVAKNFGRSGWFAVGLIFLPIIFIPILAFGSSAYVGTSE